MYNLYRMCLTRMNLKEGYSHIEEAITDALNDSIRTIAMLKGITKTVDITLVKNEPYKLPIDFIKEEFIKQGDLLLTENDYKITADYIITADDDIANNTLNLCYRYTPQALTLDSVDEISIPDAFIGVVVALTCYKYKVSVDDVSAASLFKNEVDFVLGGKTDGSN